VLLKQDGRHVSTKPNVLFEITSVPLPAKAPELKPV
jgi:hypothetical protein